MAAWRTSSGCWRSGQTLAAGGSRVSASSSPQPRRATAPQSHWWRSMTSSAEIRNSFCMHMYVCKHIYTTWNNKKEWLLVLIHVRVYHCAFETHQSLAQREQEEAGEWEYLKQLHLTLIKVQHSVKTFYSFNLGITPKLYKAFIPVFQWKKNTVQ